MYSLILFLGSQIVGTTPVLPPKEKETPEMEEIRKEAEFPMPNYTDRPGSRNLVWIRFRERIEPVLNTDLHRSESWGCGSRATLQSVLFRNDWRLCDSEFGTWAVSFEVECGKEGVLLPITLNLWPIEGVQLSVGFDLFRRRAICSSELHSEFFTDAAEGLLLQFLIWRARGG